MANVSSHSTPLGPAKGKGKEGQFMHQGHRLPGQAVPLGTEGLGHTSCSAGLAPEA